MTRAGPYIVALLLSVAATSSPVWGADRASVSVGSKKFTESVILGEVLVHLARSTGVAVVHRRELGGTRVLFNALVGGNVDAYVEYTGTIQQEILADRDVSSRGEMQSALSAVGVTMSRSLGFSNNYVLGMRKDRAAALGVRSISDLANHPELRLGWGNEFMARGDGWTSLRDRYGLSHAVARGIDHDLAYRGLESGAIDVMDLYSTDAEIAYYDLALLIDDRHHFTNYDAVLLYRTDLARRAPQVVSAWLGLEGAIRETEMIAMNKRVKIDRVSDSVVAGDFVRGEMGVQVNTPETSWVGELWRTTREHLILVCVSMIAAIAVGLPLGVWAAKSRRMAQPILGIVGIIQTIPSLALLVFLMALFAGVGLRGSLGEPPAIAALFLYSLLPIVRNTYTGLRNIPLQIRESAVAIGLPPFARLRLIELPLASCVILAGVKTATVINIGFATLGALIGAGGYGQPILTGIRLDDTALILQGAVPAALLALIAQGLFEFGERFVVPRGMRLKPVN